MEATIITAIVAAVQGIISIAKAAGQDVDLNKVMATAAVRAGASMPEYNRQLETQKGLFPDG